MYRASNRPYGRVEGSDEIRTISEDCKCAGFTQLNTETLLSYGFVLDISYCNAFPSLQKLSTKLEYSRGKKFGQKLRKRIYQIECHQMQQTAE